MSTEDTIPQGGREDARGDTTRQDAPARPEPREERHHDPRVITDADRAANPIGVAKREREQRDRDEAGRFAKGTDQQQAKPEGKDGGDKPANPAQQDRQAQGQAQEQQGDRRAPPPPPGVQAERDRRQTAEREVEQLRREMAEMRGMMMARPQAPPPAQQQPETPPEFWQDPNAAMEHRLRQAMSPFEHQLQEHRLGVSRMIAMSTHGPEKVQAAVQALGHLRQTNPAEFARLEAHASQSADPVGDVVRWHTQSSALQRFGDNPEAFIAAEVERRLAAMQQDPHRQAQAQQHEEEQQQYRQPQPVSRPPAQHQPLPSSFPAQRGGGARGGEAWGGPRPLSEITRRG